MAVGVNPVVWLRPDGMPRWQLALPTGRVNGLMELEGIEPSPPGVNPSGARPGPAPRIAAASELALVKFIRWPFLFPYILGIPSLLSFCHSGN